MPLSNLWRIFKRRSLKTRLITLVISNILGITVLIAGLSIHYVSKSAENSLELTMTEFIQYAKMDIEETIQEKKEIAQFILESYKNDSLTSKSTQWFLQNQVENNKISEYDITDESKISFITRKDISDNVTLEKALASNAPVLSNAVISSDLVYYEYAYPAEGYMVLLKIPYESLSELVNAVSIGESGNCFITDSEGYKMVHPDIENVINREENNNLLRYKNGQKEYASSAALGQKMAEGKTGFEFYDFKGTEKFSAYAPVEGTNGWSISVTATKSEFTGVVFQAVLIILVISVIAFVLSMIFTLGIINSITKPIKEIESAAYCLAEGDLNNLTITYTSQNELGSLCNSMRTLLNSLTGYIQNISQVLSQISSGDMTAKVDIEYKGDFSPIKDSMENILRSFNMMLRRINTAAAEVSTGSEQVSSASQSLAAGAAEQAASIEELTSSITNVAQSAEANVAVVRSTTDAVNTVIVKIEESNSCIQDLSSAMGEIKTSSARISAITRLIEDIAFQTNILALNAAVEAARAGETGKGFAVVADEVRNLATKSAEAAKQTSELIEYSVRKIEAGEQLSVKSADLLTAVVTQSMALKDSFGEINEASMNQSRIIEQINQGLAQVSSVVQMNAATSEESSASSEELAAQAQTMLKEISRFTLTE
ncbi:methyl-accepting chemotaxis protein [Lacrimispora sp.]|uniref:methyl-accepting chemotaxis protein n=1 Tax=Lacrimispora sp. TaxID=2719234 RepID=UPI00345FDBF3